MRLGAIDQLRRRNQSKIGKVGAVAIGKLILASVDRELFGRPGKPIWIVGEDVENDVAINKNGHGVSS